MADFSSTYQQPLQMVEKLLADANELTEENKERLKRLGEIAKIQACMENLKDASPDVKECTEAINKLHEKLLFESFMELTSKLADKSSMVKEIDGMLKEEKSGNLAHVIQIKFDEVKRYLEKANGQMKEVDNILLKLEPKVREAYGKKFKISGEEIANLKMDAKDVNRKFDASKKYLDEAEKVMGQLESDVNKEVTNFGIKVVAGVAGAAAATIVIGAGVSVMPAAAAIRSPIAAIADKLGRGGLTIVGGLTALALTLKLKLIIDNHKKSFMSRFEKLRSKLREAKTEYDVMQREIEEVVNERMGPYH